VTAASQPRQIGAWPDRARAAAREPGCTAPGLENAFPSGRAAILACLRLAGIGPDSVVATPECVTDCVADAVRRCARPVSLRAAFASCSRSLFSTAAAAIVYEQWGWPLPVDAEDSLRERLAGVPVIVDRVDSADFFSTPRSFGAFEVLSLSKALGTDAGGMARQRSDGAYVRFEPPVKSRHFPSADHPRLVSHPAVRELFKQSEYVHPLVIGWLAENCAITALEAECRARSSAVRLILDSQLSANWPAWMTRAIESGAGPVWAPVLRGRDPEVHRRAIASLAGSWGIGAAVRMFNWTGNPLFPRYEPSVALPIHGGVDSLAQIISALSA
jgi:hypothetical protein